MTNININTTKFNNLLPMVQKNINTMVRANQQVHDLPPMTHYAGDIHSVRRPINNAAPSYGYNGIGSPVIKGHG
jgi:hypothetical protein